MWKATLVATEFGHWFALLPLGLFLYLSTRLKSARNVWARGLFLFATCFFLWPLVQMTLSFATWRTQLEAAFSNPQATAAQSSLLTHKPSWLGFWTEGFHRDSIAPQTVEFDPTNQLTLEFYPAKSDVKAPWLVVVHGGGWDSGDATQLPELNSYLAARGVTVLSVNYRLAPKFTWPAQREDVLHAITYAKDHASEFNLDPSRYAILGRSAGGQIAELIAYQTGDPALKAVIGLYSPSDMNFAYEWGREDDILESRGLVRRFMGGSPEDLPRLYDDASPLNFVNAHSPPTLLMHGPRDQLVWYKHSERLSQRLKELGVPVAYLELPWATHGFDYNLSGPGGMMSTYAIGFLLGHVFSQ